MVTADDYGKVKLFNWPVVADDAPFRAYKGHASHVACVRFASDDGRVLTAGGKDRTLLQFKTHGVATHNATLLDGEMVVDDLPDGSQRRRFLVYDCVAAFGEKLIDKPFVERYGIITKSVVDPRGAFL